MFHVILDAGQVVPGVDEVNFGKAFCEKRCEGVGVGIPNDQRLGACTARLLHNAQRLTAAQEIGIFILYIQITVYIETAFLGRALEPGGDLNPVVWDIGVNLVRGEPAHARGGEAGAVELIGDGGFLVILQAQRFQTQGLKDSVGAIKGPQTGPVVVGAVIDVLAAVGG